MISFAHAERMPGDHSAATRRGYGGGDMENAPITFEGAAVLSGLRVPALRRHIATGRVHAIRIGLQPDDVLFKSSTVLELRLKMAVPSEPSPLGRNIGPIMAGGSR